MDEYQAILTALRRLPLRPDVTEGELEAQAGRLWFALVMGSGNETLPRGRGRPKAHRAAFVVAQAGGVYHALVGEAAPRTRTPDGVAVGPLVDLAAALFAALGIEASAARQVQVWLDRSARGKKVRL